MLPLCRCRSSHRPLCRVTACRRPVPKIAILVVLTFPADAALALMPALLTAVAPRRGCTMLL